MQNIDTNLCIITKIKYIRILIIYNITLNVNKKMNLIPKIYISLYYGMIIPRRCMKMIEFLGKKAKK